MDIINKISPSKKEREKINKIISIFFKKITAKLKDAKPELGGSMAKDTWLAGDHDIDIYHLPCFLVGYPATFVIF